VGGGALGDTEAGHAGLRANLRLDDVLEGFADATELGMAGIGTAGLDRDIVAVLVDEAFAHDDDAVLLALQHAADVLNELLVGERDFREIDEVRRIVRVVAALGQRGAGGEPAGVAAHDLDERHEVALAERFRIERELLDRGADVLDRAAVTGAVVGGGNVVLDRLRDADDAELVTGGGSRLGELGGGFLGLAVTDVEIILDVVRLEDGEHAVEVGRLLQLGAAGTEGGAGGEAEAADGLLRLGGEIDELLVQEAEHAVQRAIHLFDAFMIQGFGNDAGDAGVNNGGRAAGLADETISYEFCHGGVWFKAGIKMNAKAQKRRGSGYWQPKSPARQKLARGPSAFRNQLPNPALKAGRHNRRPDEKYFRPNARPQSSLPGR
jgi:hypothetical protein